MERTFALYDSDFYYATRFMEYFKKKRDVPFEVIVFTHLESLKDYLRTNNVNVLLSGSDLDEDEIYKNKVKYLYQFTEDQRGRPDTKECLVYKYQPVWQVMQELLKDIRSREHRTDPSASTEGVKIITVFLPKPRQEALAYAIALHSILSRQENVLLINLELLPVHFIKELESERSSLSEIIYYIKENKDINTRLKELLRPGMLTYLGGLDHAEDILALDSEDANKLVETLRSSPDYQTILFYINCASEALMELIIQSDALITINSHTEYDQALYNTWLKQLQRYGRQLPQEKCFNVDLFEEDFGQVPISMAKLMDSKAWRSAEACLESIGL